MGFQLYEHQRSAVEALHSGAILCGGVGTGKSRTALAYYISKVCGIDLNAKRYDVSSRNVPLYVITTARKRDTLEWDEECSHFLLSRNSNGRKTVVIDSWNNIKKYVDVTGAFFIFDEQRLVGTGAWVKAFLKISKFNEWILLTATPGDTWLDYAPVFIANGFYKNITEFRMRHVVYHRYSKFPKVERYIDEARLERYRKAITVQMEFKKPAVQHHEWIKVPYDEETYKAIEKNKWNIFKDEPITNKAELCYIMRKVVNSDSRRLKKLKDIFDKHGKLVVFYNFDYELEALRDFCETVGVEYSEWNGHKHQDIPDSVKWIYLVQYSAGSEGWNCIVTDTMVFFSQNYSYRTSIQASGRIDRMNTKYTDLYYYHLYSDSSIDKSIKACLSKKKNFNEKNFAASIGLA